jgi:hypothetical protein
MMMKCICREEDIQLLWIFIVAYADHNRHGIRSSGKPSNMVSTDLQPRMM